MTATYWEVGRRIVEVEQKGEGRAEHGTRLIERLSGDLTKRFGRGFSQRNLEQMRRFYLGWRIPQTLSAELLGERPDPIQQTLSVESVKAGKAQTPSAKSVSEKSQTSSGKLQAASATFGAGEEGQAERVRRLAARFPLPWSRDVRLMSVKDNDARRLHRRLKKGG